MAEPRRIVVAGDVRIDELDYETLPLASDGARWERSPQARRADLRGDSLLLARFLREVAGAGVITCDMPSEDLARANAIRATASLERFPGDKRRKDTTWRVGRFAGFAGPADRSETTWRVTNDDADAELVVLDDAGNGFADTPEVWPEAIRQGDRRPLVVLKTRDTDLRSALAGKLLAEHPGRLVLLMRADDLRERGANISRGLSWERTASDLLRQLGANPALSKIGACNSVIVTFGLEGAVLLRRTGDGTDARLFYDPLSAEGDCAANAPGTMIGLQTAFAAALCATLQKGGLEALSDGVRHGLRAARLLHATGFGTDAETPDYPKDLLAKASEPHATTSEIALPNPGPSSEHANDWSIAQTLSGARLGVLASELVVRGPDAIVRGTPMAKFGLLTSLDRAEIEGYRSVSQLIREYATRTNASRPLCLAAFGPPGSGKSFAVTQIAQCQGRVPIERLVFNVAQLASAADLAHALHRVRDVVLNGKLPLAFFDEFDADLDGRPLGWLKYFLAPMQDGEFRDGETVHPIGRAIFVFAGGTTNSFEEFSTPSSEPASPAAAAFRAAKGTDFVSRLRGYVNVRGPDPVYRGDRAAILRRALVLRSLLERKAPWLVRRTGIVAMDPGVLRAFLRIPRYAHGVRSMEALIEMSQLAARRGYEQAALPPRDQLRLHVDADAFLALVDRDVLFGESREAIAKAIHEQYRTEHSGDRDADDASLKPWEEVDEALRESNRRQADDIARKLLRIGCDFRPVTSSTPALIEFSPEEIELLAEVEHGRWVDEREAAGWTLGPRDPEAKATPYLVPWETLKEMPGNPQDWDRQAILNIPKVMANAGFEIYRADLPGESSS
jgi:hypothetical protein